MEDVIAERVNQLERRVNTLEERIAKQLDDIFRVVDGLRDAMHQDEVDAARVKVCPQPGLCLVLQGALTRATDELAALRKEVYDITQWRTGIVAKLSVVMFILVMFGTPIRDWVVAMFSRGTP